MPAQQTGSSSRRVFLGSVVAGAAAAAQGAVLQQQGTPVQLMPDRMKDQTRLCNLNGIVPTPNTLSGVLVETATDSYFVFKADQFNEIGETLQSGSGVWRLQDCYARKFRTIGDAHLAVHPVDFSKLEVFCTYEVFNSSWVNMLVNGNRTEAEKLHHYIITLDNVRAFECVVEKIDSNISTLPFWELQAWMMEMSGEPAPIDQGFVLPSPTPESSPQLSPPPTSPASQNGAGGFGTPSL